MSSSSRVIDGPIVLTGLFGGDDSEEEVEAFEQCFEVQVRGAKHLTSLQKIIFSFKPHLIFDRRINVSQAYLLKFVRFVLKSKMSIH